MYWLQKRLLSQNFLVNRELVEQLVRDAGIDKNDTVLEIGPGRGIITEQLVKVANHVIAVEKDIELSQRLPKWHNLTLIKGDFLDTPLPFGQYKVFTNPPFSITGEIIRKLLQSANPPRSINMVAQNEAASKFIIHPGSNTMAAILYYPFWDLKIIHRFQRSDFSPQPRVDSVLVHIQPRTTPWVSVAQKALYQDFVAYHFTHDRLAKFVPPSKWLQLFKTASPSLLKTVSGAFNRLNHEQRGLHKIHRTRTNPNGRGILNPCSV